jgi:hypothetical protein
MHRGALRDFAMRITYVRIYERRRMRRGRTALRSETRKEEAARDADEVFKSRCRALLARIPDPHWGNA